jgi:hypothetical protein
MTPTQSTAEPATGEDLAIYQSIADNYNADHMNAHYLAGVEAGRASRAQSEPREFQEYFESHRAFVAAKNASDAATHANIVGYMNPGNSGATDFDRVVARNKYLGESADKARKASDSAMARFQAAKTAAALVSAPATLGETK